MDADGPSVGCPFFGANMQNENQLFSTLFGLSITDIDSLPASHIAVLRHFALKAVIQSDELLRISSISPCHKA